MIVEVGGQKALGFDTGLDSRAFAQAKLARLITEPGLIVRPHRIELWKASGVLERSDCGGRPTMAVWGPLFEGARLDLLLDESAEPDKILAAICAWIQAILALGENADGGIPGGASGGASGGAPGGAPGEPLAAVSLRPSAATIAQDGESGDGAPGGAPGGALPFPAVFFAPPDLARLCISAADESYVHPDLDGMKGAAFTSAAMLYRLFAGTSPFPAADESTLHQDIREGNFLPVRLAIPGLDTRLAALLQEALDPPHGSGAKLLSEILAATQPDGRTVSAASLIQPLSEEHRLLLEKEKAQFLKIKTASVKTRRFVTRNSALLLGCLAAFVAAVLVTVSIAQSRSRLPSTAGMEPVQVIESYYNAFGELDHQMMEACVTDGAGKDDINAVINLFVINKTRQAYEFKQSPSIISAREWRQGGGDSDTQVFGVTDLQITNNREQVTNNREQVTDNKEQGTGNRDAGEVRYCVDYILWVSGRLSGDAGAEDAENSSPLPYYRSDIVTLVRKKERRGFNWRIAEIQRMMRE